MASGPSYVVLSDQQHLAWHVLGPQKPVSGSTNQASGFQAKPTID